MIVAIIPARGGSKRISGKNIRDFRGKPMIAWAITAAQDSGCFDEIVVSTDSEEIASVAESFGASVPFIRPQHLADDHTPTIPVLRHAIDEINSTSNTEIAIGCCIYATAPFLTPSALREGLETLESDDMLDFSFSVTSFPFPIQRALEITDSGRVEMISPKYELTRSQDLPERYHDAGQFYWFRSKGIFNNNGFFSAKSAPVILERKFVQDIDTLEDWEAAEIAHALLEKAHDL
ncbi:MAG: pseudaminic acid cytidylyltransferase [Verrucomicrobiota bacterium]